MTTFYDELASEAQLTRDVAVIRRAMKEIDDGKGLDVEVAFGSIRAELLAMKGAGQDRAAAE